MKKRFMVCLTALMILFGTDCMALGESSSENPVSRCEDYEYTLDENGNAAITKYHGKAQELTIPGELEGHCVVAIEDEAFFNCDSLSSITLPDSVSEIGSNPFRNCSLLTTISVSPDHAYYEVIDNVLFEKATKTLISYPSGSEENAYTVPNGTLAIGDMAFIGCKSLSSVILPDSLISIENRAFCDCDSLSDISLPDSLVSIGDWAFCDCDSLGSIILPDSLVSIGERAFSECDSLSSIALPDSLTSIGNYAFCWCNSLRRITLPDFVAKIGNNPFFNCPSLTAIFISPDHPYFAVIDNVLFEKATKTLISYPLGLKEQTYTVPDGVLAIGDLAFNDCDSLSRITLPDSLTSIGIEAFDGCDSLSSITLPASLTSIGDYAFDGCNSLTLTVVRDSYAAKYAKENDLPHQYTDALDWLSN